MVFETLNFNYSTALSITFMQCCKIVLMFYNGTRMVQRSDPKGALYALLSTVYGL